MMYKPLLGPIIPLCHELSVNILSSEQVILNDLIMRVRLLALGIFRIF
jgi:hypothetical protein